MLRPRRKGRFATAIAALLLAACAAAAAPPKENLVAGPPSGPWRRLFLDAGVVEQQQGLDRVFHAAAKHPANPVVKHDKPWEGRSSYAGPYLYGTVMWDGGKLRMWYHSHTGSGYRNCYAESADGIAWTKPNLGLVDFGGSKDNNLLLTAMPRPGTDPPAVELLHCHSPSVIKRPWERDPAKRYAFFCYGIARRRNCVGFSPDGLRWTFDPKIAEKGLFPSGDVQNYFFDPYKSRYVATRKTGNRRGRAAGVAVSSDGLNWTLPTKGPVFGADDLDPDATQVYGMPVFPYQGIYIGLPWIYNARWFKYGSYGDRRMYEVEKDSPRTMDCQLAWSWDLINWTRPPRREQFIPRGKEGEFDSGMIYTAQAPVQVGGKLHFYYGGWVGAHSDTKSKANIGLATLRLDGFCSMHAGDAEGWLISRREPFQVPRIAINARTAPNGYVVAELLDKLNNPIAGFTRADCVPFTGDSTRHVLTWKAKALPKELLDADKKIRFFLKNADLYSYLPDQTTGPVTVIYDPSANGGLLPSDPKLPARQRFRMGGRPSGYKLVKDGAWTYLDLHSVAAHKTNAAFHKDQRWDDDTDWCLEAWYRVIDRGTEPNYGLATSMRPDTGRGAALYLSDKAVGIISTQGNAHKTLKSVPMDTTDAFHWYRMVHEGGADGTVSVAVDGKEVLRMPFRDLFVRCGRGYNIVFGPNAGHCEGRMHVARFGYRVGSTDLIFGPVKTPAPPR